MNPSSRISIHPAQPGVEASLTGSATGLGAGAEPQYEQPLRASPMSGHQPLTMIYLASIMPPRPSDGDPRKHQQVSDQRGFLHVGDLCLSIGLAHGLGELIVKT